jgi:homocysteine S-methyltransferase
MVKSVQLANEAKRRFYLEREDVVPGDIQIALSLGPFGATLSPTQEFQGCYPPPYGPKCYSEKQENTNSFEGKDVAEETAVEALAQFHFERLIVFASKPEVWEGIDCLAFETVPLAREIRAIRRALTMLGECEQFAMKPSWISFVFPDGRFPETDGPKGPPLTVRQVVRSALEQGIDGRVPDAIGINCTRIEFLPRLLVQLEEAIASICKGDISKPWLVIYPNGGDVYDSISRKWIAAEKPMNARIWAEDLVHVVQRAVAAKAWDGIIVGGCCRTGPLEIEGMARLMVEQFALRDM